MIDMIKNSHEEIFAGMLFDWVKITGLMTEDEIFELIKKYNIKQ